MTRAAAPNQQDVVVLPDAEAIAKNAAERLLARIAAASGSAAICLTGGSGPERLYQLLADEPYRNRLPWDRVHWFMGDDRFVPAQHAHSNMGMARRLFLALMDKGYYMSQGVSMCAISLAMRSDHIDGLIEAIDQLV